jgi:protein-tyrosine phosphatase
MIDIHCHPLSGLDDGAKSFEVSVAMCRMAAADGITHLVATPHCNYTYAFDPEITQKKIAELQAAVGEAPQLLPGCDFHLSYDNIQRCVQNPAPFTINHTTYLLVELADQFIPELLDRVFYEIQVAGLTPIISHPERNPVCQRKSGLLEHWVKRGCLIQITAQSYTSGFGRQALRLAEHWLDRNLVHFFASDAHDAEYRRPVLSECYRKLLATKGQETAERLLQTNPEAVINGRPMPRQPPPVESAPAKRKRRWFSFLWR